METNPARGRFGLMRPLPLSVAFSDGDRILQDGRSHFVRRNGSDCFLPVLAAAALIASAVIFALD
jgi:hypothetical protein